MGWSVCVCGGGGGCHFVFKNVRFWGMWWSVCVCVCVCGGGGGGEGVGIIFRKSTSEQDLWSQHRNHHHKPPQV